MSPGTSVGMLNYMKSIGDKMTVGWRCFPYIELW